MRRSYIPANFEFPGIAKNFLDQGLGLFISDSSMGFKLYSNGGDVDGMEAYHAFVPELNLGIAVMVNSMIALPQCLISWIIDYYSNAPRIDWVNEILPIETNKVSSFFSDLVSTQKRMTDPSRAPSLDISSYAGFYRHPLLGSLTIQYESERLFFTLGTCYRGELLPAYNDTFFIKVSTPRYSKLLFSGEAQFRLDKEGRVSSLFVVDKIFQRVGGGK